MRNVRLHVSAKAWLPASAMRRHTPSVPTQAAITKSSIALVLPNRTIRIGTEQIVLYELSPPLTDQK